MDFTLRIDTHAPWLKRKTKQLIDNFEMVVARAGRPCRTSARRAGAALLQASAPGVMRSVYGFPLSCAGATYIDLRKPKRESL